MLHEKILYVYGATFSFFLSVLLTLCYQAKIHETVPEANFF